jgi:hypothetical protein
VAFADRDDESHSENLDLTALNRALQDLYRTRALIGTMPPAPATARGRAGSLLVRLVHRALFWLWPQLDSFHAAMINFAERQFAWMEEVSERLAEIDDELERMRQILTPVDNRAVTVDTAAEPAGQLWLQLVKCQARIESVRQGMRFHE